jgi:hypothetical protein
VVIRRNDESGGVGLKGEPFGELRAASVALLLLGLSLGLTACASRSERISLGAEAADSELQTLARRAEAGDKRAQLELGIRFEEGRGLPVDRERAAFFYRLAARATGGTKWTHAPDVKGVKGSPQRVYLGPRQPGLPEAKERLERLRRTGPPADRSGR